MDFYLFGAHREGELRGRPGEIVATRTGAVCRATVDGAVWISHLQRPDTPRERFFKLPATLALALAGRAPGVPEITATTHVSGRADQTYGEIAYEEQEGVGYLRFDFYNGAMSSEQCRRLLDAYRYARSRVQTRVIVLLGGEDFFSNGIDLNVIQGAGDPALESWGNLHAIDDLVREIIVTDSHLVISALRGDAAAGGVPFALAADLVVARNDVVLNPYYQHMGGLYGSEYWTYLLPRRVGADMTRRLTSAPFISVGAREAARIGLLDDAFGATLAGFDAGTRVLAARLARDGGLPGRLDRKRARRARDEQTRPLEVYREQELARCHECFFGADRSYHEARAVCLQARRRRQPSPVSRQRAARRVKEPLMLMPVHDHPTLRSPASALVPASEQAAPIAFAAGDDDLYKHMPADRARRFAELRATLREAKRASRRDQRPHTQPRSLSPAAGRLRDATTYYQQHVLAWYALSQIHEAHAAKQAITHCREALTAENPRNPDSRTDHRTTSTPPHPLSQETLIHN